MKRKAFTVIIANTTIEIVPLVIKRKIKLNVRFFTDTDRGYDIFGISEFYHKSINHDELFLVKQKY